MFIFVNQSLHRTPRELRGRFFLETYFSEISRHMFGKADRGWRCGCWRLWLEMAFTNFPLQRHLTFNKSTSVKEFLHPCLFMIMATSITLMLAQDFDVFDEVGVCGSIQELVRKSETSNLSEVCSGSDCHDNNMGTLTKWDKNPAQNNFNYCIFLSALAQLAYFWWWL